MIETKNKIVLDNILEYTLYDEINVEDRLFISWKMFEKATGKIYEKIMKIQKENSITFDGIYAIPRGGLVLGVKLSYMTKLPLITDENEITKNTLIVDDFIRTGKTLSKFNDNFTCVMFCNPNSNFKPDLCFQETGKQINFCWESKDERN